MIAWLSNSGGVPVVPACLDGWAARDGHAIVHVDLAGTSHMVGVGDALAFPTPRRWADLDGGWKVGLNSPRFDPRALVRSQGWADLNIARDMHGREWYVPVVRSAKGGRAYRVAYGRDWLPELTPEQARADEISEAAVSAILGGGEFGMSVACQWAAELLSMAAHITPEVIAALVLMDDTLTVDVLTKSLNLELSGPTP